MVPVIPNWLRRFIDERRALSYNLELQAHETAAINFFLDQLEAAADAESERRLREADFSKPFSNGKSAEALCKG